MHNRCNQTIQVDWKLMDDVFLIDFKSIAFRCLWLHFFKLILCKWKETRIKITPLRLMNALRLCLVRNLLVGGNHSDWTYDCKINNNRKFTQNTPHHDFAVESFCHRVYFQKHENPTPLCFEERTRQELFFGTVDWIFLKEIKVYNFKNWCTRHNAFVYFM